MTNEIQFSGKSHKINPLASFVCYAVSFYRVASERSKRVF